MTHAAPPRRATRTGAYERDAEGHLRYVCAEAAEPTPPKNEFLYTGTTSDGSETGVIPAFLIDMALHAAIGATVWHLAQGPTAVLYGILAWLTTSFLHRTIVQRLTRTTIGKCSFGLRLRHPDGTYPSLWQLITQWFRGGWACFDFFGTFS
ncbi:RDD family protein [Nocardia asteroides]|uniref:RDD family protein n=1 Tax=Nocardia asteroides TaxID=1824 RepID=UPI001E652147|nr:RDD family protein [Nocardia asteroides]UGT57141.1 RDD family protein [Nocardia asteroides]